MTTTSDTTEPGRSRHRSRSRRSKREKTGSEAMNLVRGATAGRVIAIVMIIMAIGYVGSAYRSFSLQLGVYGDVAINGSYEDTLYALGRPAKVRAADTAPWTSYAGPGHDAFWQYNTAGERNLVVHFDDGRVDRINCIDVEAIRGTCPESFGLGVGHTEAALFTQLGRPATQRLVAQRKIVTYPELGLELGLETYTIMQVEQRQPTSSAFLRFLRWIIP